MEDKYLITVAIPTHNNEEYIEKAVMSVVNQTFKESLEILVLNDACTDHTDEIIERLMKQYPNIHYLHVNNRSEGATRMDAIRNAKGKYMMWLDGDDYYHPDMVKTMYETIKENDADWVNCSFYIIRKNGIKKNLITKNIVFKDIYQAVKAYFNDTYFRGFFHTKIFKTDLLRQNELDLPKLSFVYVDTLFNFYYLLHCKKVVSINKPLLYYNKTNEGSLTNKAKNRMQDNINVRAGIKRKIDLSNDPKLLKLFLRQKKRIKQLLLVDYIYSHFETKKQKRLAYKQAKKDLKLIYSKNPLPMEVQTYSQFLKETLK